MSRPSLSTEYALSSAWSVLGLYPLPLAHPTCLQGVSKDDGHELVCNIQCVRAHLGIMMCAYVWWLSVL